MNEKQLVTTTSILPVFADRLEDMPFTHKAKELKNKLIFAIREFDKHMIDTADIEAMEQQLQIQQAYIQFEDNLIKL